MNDVGIDLLKPRYPAQLFNPADLAYWEVLYDDGTVLSEAAGGTYAAIDRGRLQSFRIIFGGTIVFELFPTNGHTGYELVYRRRSTLGSGDGFGRGVTYIIGLVPDGPFYALDLDRGEFREDPSLLATLAPMPGEPDDLLTPA